MTTARNSAAKALCEYAAELATIRASTIQTLTTLDCLLNAVAPERVPLSRDTARNLAIVLADLEAVCRVLAADVRAGRRP